MIKAAIAVSLVFAAWTPCTAQSANECDFSGLQVHTMTDLKPVHWVNPRRPSEADGPVPEGTVHLRLLINNAGRVERVCPFYPSAEPKADPRLVTVAKEAALQWTFPPNFGLKAKHKPQFDYVEEDVTINFHVTSHSHSK